MGTPHHLAGLPEDRERLAATAHAGERAAQMTALGCLDQDLERPTLYLVHGEVEAAVRADPHPMDRRDADPPQRVGDAHLGQEAMALLKRV